MTAMSTQKLANDMDSHALYADRHRRSLAFTAYYPAPAFLDRRQKRLALLKQSVTQDILSALTLTTCPSCGFHAYLTN